MAVESLRRCGTRRAGGIYLVTDGLGEPCERLPLPLDTCPTCGAGVRQTRSWQWVNPDLVFKNPKIKPCAMSADEDLGPGAEGLRGHCPHCVVCTPGLLETMADPRDRVGLLWVGKGFYASAEDWSREAGELGVSKRIAAIPKGLVVGRSWVFVAHPEAVQETREIPPAAGELLGKTEIRHTPGIFHAFVPKRIEVVVTPSMKEESWVKDLVEKHGVALVEVPEDDPDHAPRATRKTARARSMDRAARRMARKKEEVA